MKSPLKLIKEENETRTKKRRLHHSESKDKNKSRNHSQFQSPIRSHDHVSQNLDIVNTFYQAPIVRKVRTNLLLICIPRRIAWFEKTSSRTSALKT